MTLKKLIACVFLLLPWRASAQEPEFASLRTSWESEQYATVLPKLVDYWGKPGGRTWQVGYMIGTSQCRIAGKESLGVATLEEVLMTFPLLEEVRNTVADERRACSAQAEPSRAGVATVGTVILQVSGGSRVSGKGGFIFADRNTLPTSQMAISPVSAEELRKRVLPIAQAQEAANAGLKRMGLSGDGARFVGPFAVAYPFGASAATEIGKCLLNFEGALRQQFSMELPEGVVTVYGVPEVDQVQRFAQKLHGIRLPAGTLAYSVYEDLSIVGPGGPEGCGSLAHELVHLMIRRRFGNSPPWLEEGLASEVAIAGIRSGQLGFGPSWRDDMLRAQWTLRPKVSELIGWDWAAYTPSSRITIQQAAATQAMAASFIRYLASQKKLEQIYFAGQNDHFRVDSAQARSYQQIVESGLGKSIDQIDADFVAWFGPPAAPRTGGAAGPLNGAPPAQGPRQEGPQQQSPRK
jgi:hypothetical protein